MALPWWLWAPRPRPVLLGCTRPTPPDRARQEGSACLGCCPPREGRRTASADRDTTPNTRVPPNQLPMFELKMRTATSPTAGDEVELLVELRRLKALAKQCETPTNPSNGVVPLRPSRPARRCKARRELPFLPEGGQPTPQQHAPSRPA